MGFRYAVRDRARARGVSGYVRNLPGGEVEAVFESDADAVESLVEFCRRGPRGADVSGVDVEDCEAAGLTGFEVR